MPSIGKTIQNFFKPKSSNVLGIDISSSSVKVVELTKKQGRASLVTYGELSLGPYAGAEIGRATNLPVEKTVEALQDILREAKVSTKNCGVAIPMSSSLIRLVEMPDLGEEKLKSMIPLEIRKYIPVPISEVLLDWWIIPGESSSSSGPAQIAAGSAGPVKKVDVLVVAIHNDIISRYQDIVKRAELESSFFEIEIFSTLRAVLDRNAKPLIIVDIGAATTKVYVVEKGIIRSSHIVNSGSQDITLTLSSIRNISISEAEEEKRAKGMDGGLQQEGKMVQGPSVVLENILFEAKRVKISYERKSGKKIDSALFTGGGSMVIGLEKKANEILELPIKLADPFSRVETPTFLNDLLKKIGPEFSVAIGVALRKLEERK